MSLIIGSFFILYNAEMTCKFTQIILDQNLNLNK